ncbi:hypothetical protein [Marinobacter oulmenensis]|uniref:Uncharacterized protein n=1 Tax=Marinobacter oulmenensis TaxID=643747 RepID=A0A840U2Q1_9GAMM|nr:hypothetical protein [Marinobacter oulmenensis]MBB5319974.1 hypothetical protein [Marinobacter oulmenensis]
MATKTIKGLITASILIFCTPSLSHAEKGPIQEGIETLNRLKQRMILEQMAGDGETKLQRALQRKLDGESQSQDSGNSTMNQQLCEFWKQQNESERRTQKIESYCS